MSVAELKDRWATLATKIVTVPINETASGDRTIRVIQPGQFFLVYGFFLQIVGAGTVTFIWKSGSTAISGAMALATNGALSVFDQIPVLKGRAAGDDLVLNLASAGAISVQGWCSLTEGSF